MASECQLVFTEGPRQGGSKAFVANEIIIGREATCDLVLLDRGLSRRHCRIVRDADGWFIEDLGSRNGLRVNGELVRRQRLQRGDTVTIGVSVFTFTDEPVAYGTLIDDGAQRDPNGRS